MNHNVRMLQFAYWSSLILVVFLALLTPMLIHEGISIFKEEVLELILLAVLLVTGGTLLWKYARFVEWRDESYNELVRHVGALNLQVDQIETIVQSANRVPRTQRELRHMFEVMGKIILSVVEADWVLLRALDTAKGSTITEQMVFYDRKIDTPRVPNKILQTGATLDGTTVYTHVCDDTVSLYVVISSPAIASAQETVVQTATTNTGLLFKIFTETQKIDSKN